MSKTDCLALITLRNSFLSDGCNPYPASEILISALLLAKREGETQRKKVCVCEGERETECDAESDWASKRDGAKKDRNPFVFQAELFAWKIMACVLLVWFGRGGSRQYHHCLFSSRRYWEREGEKKEGWTRKEKGRGRQLTELAIVSRVGISLQPYCAFSQGFSVVG